MNKLTTSATRWIGDYLTYNRTEQRGIVVLCLILLVVIAINVLIPAGTLQNQPDFSHFSKEIVAFEKAWEKAADSERVSRLKNYHRINTFTAGILQDSTKRALTDHKPLLRIELNAADTFDLQQLKGIGPAFARRIVNYRARLRGFYNKEQLKEIFGMDSVRYHLIEANVWVNNDSIHPFDLNTVTFKDLLKHPYFPFPVTKRIMLSRKERKTFKALEELRNIEGINDSLFRRMIIYLRIAP